MIPGYTLGLGYTPNSPRIRGDDPRFIGHVFRDTRILPVFAGMIHGENMAAGGAFRFSPYSRG